MEMLANRHTRGYVPVEPGAGLEKRIIFLDEPDRKLVELSLRGKLTRREAALLLGMSAGNVTRRLKRLMDRLADPLVVALIDHGELLPESYREVGIGYFLRAMTVFEIARALGLTPGEVRRALLYVRGWYGAKHRPETRTPIQKPETRISKKTRTTKSE